MYLKGMDSDNRRERRKDQGGGRGRRGQGKEGGTRGEEGGRERRGEGRGDKEGRHR